MEETRVSTTIADGKQLLHGETGRETAKIHPKSAFELVLIGRVLGRWLMVDGR